MKKIIILAIIFSVIILIYLLVSSKTNDNNQQLLASPIPEVDITAEFKIITNGTTRIFSDKKYHNLSKEVFVTSQNPNVIKVKKDGITWSDFFKTLPMNLSKSCLITGTGQEFCTNNVYSLTFTLNGVNDPNVLDKKIFKDDYLLVEYK